MNQLLLLTIIPLWVVVLLNVLLTIALIRKFNTQTDLGFPSIKPMKVGEEAPEFSAVTITNEAVTQTAYEGKNVAFVFVSPHCGPCHDVLPVIESLKPQAKQAQVELVFVSDSNLAETKAFATEYGIQLPILSASQMDGNPFYNDYKVGGTPFYCLVQDGKIAGADFLLPNCENLAEHWQSTVKAHQSKLNLQPA